MSEEESSNDSYSSYVPSNYEDFEYGGYDDTTDDDEMSDGDGPADHEAFLAALQVIEDELAALGGDDEDDDGEIDFEEEGWELGDWEDEWGDGDEEYFRDDVWPEHEEGVVRSVKHPETESETKVLSMPVDFDVMPPVAREEFEAYVKHLPVGMGFKGGIARKLMKLAVGVPVETDMMQRELKGLYRYPQTTPKHTHSYRRTATCRCRFHGRFITLCI